MSGGKNSAMASVSSACNCVGPQNGEPFCPCQMRGMIKRDGRWIRPEKDCGPVVPEPKPIAPGLGQGNGCICPPGAERTCRGPFCPRVPWKLTCSNEGGARG